MVTFDDICRRPGETFAAHMRRVRAAGVFTTWPRVLDGPLPRPWRIGIYDDFLARLDPARCDASTLRAWVQRMAGSRLYLEAMSAYGAMRHDVDGIAVEPVAETHRAYARAWLAERARKRQRCEAEEERRRRLHPANATKPVLRLGVRP